MRRSKVALPAELVVHSDGATPEDPPIYTKSPEELGMIVAKDTVDMQRQLVARGLVPPTGLLASSPSKLSRKKKPKSNGAMEARASMAKASVASNASLEQVSSKLPQRPDEDECDRAMIALFREIRAWRRLCEAHGTGSYERPLIAAVDRYDAALAAVVDEDERLAALELSAAAGEHSDPPL